MGRALVTGGGSGIGLGIARALRDAGHEVTVVGRREEVLVASGFDYTVADVTSGSLHMVGVDHLVNCAGHLEMAPVGEWTAEVWRRLHEVHVVAPAMLAQAFAAQACQVGEGTITNIASTLAVRTDHGLAAYSAAKAALVSLTRSLAIELAPRIRANAVLPGVVKTAMTGSRADDLVGLHPLGRLGTPDDIGQAVAYLVANAQVTGEVLSVDGGLLL
ncbi:MAG: SDR family oxidoreductase [Proteobacteria bacterium]|nr:SDR family oxidoreductase [Pseudomonadota bacterium]MCP4919738.1 SDR family oxidoreductase [Pseudomonadota bacterium]